MRHTLAANLKAPAMLRARWDVQLGLAFQCRNDDIMAQCCLGDVNRKLEIQVITVARKKLMLLHIQDDIQVPGRSAFGTDLPFACQPYLLSAIDAGRNLDRKLLVTLFSSLAAASRARRPNDLSLALAGVAHHDVDKLA